jgi:hypothetical protein
MLQLIFSLLLAPFTSYQTSNITVVSAAAVTATPAPLARGSLAHVYGKDLASKTQIANDETKSELVMRPLPMNDQYQNFLIVYMSGIRNRGTEGATAIIGGITTEVLYAGPEGKTPGVDQVNIRIPTTLVNNPPPLTWMTITVNGVTARSDAVWLKRELF